MLISAGAEIGMTHGAVWKENLQGTTGVGTCIETETAVTILGEDHFSNVYKGLTCTVAPIFNFDGSLCAVLNVTTPFETNYETQELVKKIVTLSAKRIQHNLFRLKYKDNIILRLSQFSNFADITLEGLLVLDGNGVISDMENCGDHKSDLNHFDIIKGQKVSDVLGKSLDEIQSDFADHSIVHIQRSIEKSQKLFLKLHTPSSETSKSTLYPVQSRSRKQPENFTAELSRLCGHDPKMIRNTEIALKVSKLGIPILLYGETGTGKGVMAKAIHYASDRKSKPFVSVNCAAIPEDIIERELFGDRKSDDKNVPQNAQSYRGRILEANGGTLFLDEIGDMPHALQTRLLRVLSEGELIPMGGGNKIKLSLRVISATRHDLNQLVEEGHFREDLLYRLNGACLQLPTLKERTDIKNIISAILAKASETHEKNFQLSEKLQSYLETYFWPGNIRELENTLNYCMAVAETEILDKSHLPQQVLSPQTANPDTDAQLIEEKEIALLALQREKWNVSAAARMLGISRATMHRKINQFDLRKYK